MVQAGVAGVAGYVGQKWGGVSDGGVDQLVAVEISTVDTGVGSVDEESGVSLRLGLTLDQMSVAGGQGSVDAVVVGDNGGLDNSGEGSIDRGHNRGGVGDWVDHVVSIEDTSTVDIAVETSSVGVDNGKGVSLSLTLDQVGVASIASGQGSVDAIVVGDNWGLDNSWDNGLGGNGGQVGHKWGGVGHGGVDQLVAVETSTIDTGVGSVHEESGVSLRLGLGVSLTLDVVGAIDMGVSSGVGDNGAGHSLVDKGEGLLDHWCSGNSLDDGGAVDQGLVQVSVSLGSQVLGLGGLDRQGVVRDHSSIGVLHLRVNLGVGITIDTSNQRLGKEDLGVSLGGSLGGSSQSNSNKSFHFWFLFLYFLPS